MQLDALQSLALSVARARSPRLVLEEMVRGLGMTDGVALARVWLIEHDGEGAHLRLRASVGFSIAEPDVRWTRTDGAHGRIPLSYGKVGRIASTAEPLLLRRGGREWLMEPDWADREHIETFAGQPLVFRGECLGVVAVFTRKTLDRAELGWLRVFADHAAVAIANARAFEEIEQLKERLERERDYLRGEVRRALHPGEPIYESAAMQAVMAQVSAVARTHATVLVLGESGVGKELVASAIHDLSSRADAPLVKVNCASIPRDLFESEFFGHVRGAFSGASRDREGRFQLAHGGTLFLDEVGEIPLELQGKLLRVLQEQEFEPVGDDRTRRVDVRVVAATNRDLESEIEAGRFRRDLYYRLSVVPIAVPPLRCRRQDVLPLARQFLRSTAQRLNTPTPELTPDEERRLLAHHWPGNIRELRNVMERVAVMAQARAAGERLHLPPPGSSLRGAPGRRAEPPEATRPSEPPGDPLQAVAEGAVIPVDELRSLERQNLINALERCRWKVAGPDGAAALLGMRPSTLRYQMKSLGIERPPASHRSTG